MRSATANTIPPAPVSRRPGVFDGQLVLAAKVTHVPSLMLSEEKGSPLKAAREGAVRALRELGRRAKERRVSTFVVFDTHWLSNFGYHINANPAIMDRSRAMKPRR